MIQPTAEELSDPVKRRDLDRRMILSPDDWPTWPRLALKPRPPRKGTSLAETCAFIHWDDLDAPPSFPLTIGLGTMFFDPLATTTYDDIEALLNDWTVD